MKKKIRVLKELIHLRFQRLMLFRIGFFGPFFVDGSLFLLQLLVFEAIYANVDQIGDWEKGEMIIFIGTFSMINALNMIVYFFGVNNLQDKIRNGELDLYLTKPISPLFRITFEQINPGSIPLLFLSLLIVIYGIIQGNFTVTLGNVIKYIYGVIIMTILWYEMEIIVRSLAFYVTSTTNITRLEEAGIDLCMKIPGVVFKGVFKVLFYCIMPYGIMATFPTLSLAGKDSVTMLLYGTAIVIIFGGITAMMWKCGLKRYNSVSS